jgi:hypothetical protein
MEVPVAHGDRSSRLPMPEHGDGGQAMVEYICILRMF